MDPFELNKILGAALANCIVLLGVHLFADSEFAPVQPAKPGFKIVAKEETATTAPGCEDRGGSADRDTTCKRGC